MDTSTRSEDSRPGRLHGNIQVDGISMGIDELIKGRREAIIRAAEEHGARNVRVFGSFARGDAGIDSDLDLLVDAGPRRTPFFPGGLVADLEELLGRRVAVLTVDGIREDMREKIVNESRPL